jgi:hypothetical protein
MAGLAEREGDLSVAECRTREVVEAFVEEEVGEIMDNEDDVDAFEALRPRRTISLGPAEFEARGSLRLRK